MPMVQRCIAPASTMQRQCRLERKVHGPCCVREVWRRGVTGRTVKGGTNPATNMATVLWS
eukprot:2802072-Prorocentrum_lima.AAC.1